VFNVRDNRLASGSVSLYCGQNAGGQFRDVRVDDLRGNAPVVYRFKFTTSDFTDFRHHIHSFQGLVFRAALADLNDVAASVGAAVALAAANQQPAEAEARVAGDFLSGGADILLTEMKDEELLSLVALDLGAAMKEG
jgi:hypothetical protein